MQPLDIVGFNENVEYGTTVTHATDDPKQPIIFFPMVGDNREYNEDISVIDIQQIGNTFENVWVYINLEDIIAYGTQGDKTALYIRNAEKLVPGKDTDVDVLIATVGPVTERIVGSEAVIELIIPTEDFVLPTDPEVMEGLEALPSPFLENTEELVEANIVQGQPGVQVSDTTQTWRNQWQS